MVTNTYLLSRALSRITDRALEDTEDIHDAFNIETADGKELEKLAVYANTSRKDGESDSKFRKRIKLRIAAGKLGTTRDDVQQFLGTLFETNPENIGLNTDLANDPATVEVDVPKQILNEAELTDSELGAFVSDIIPLGHEAFIEVDGTFAVTSDAGEGLNGADNGLTSDSISTGGTLSKDI